MLYMYYNTLSNKRVLSKQQKRKYWVVTMTSNNGYCKTDLITPSICDYVDSHYDLRNKVG